jgi:AraC family transcriptional regulator, dual regulator of chb operon
MSPARLLWNTMESGERGFHIARHGRSVEASPVHTHDFAEVFWIDSGEAIHHFGDSRHRVQTGDVVLVAPDDTHRLLQPSHDFAMMNLALSQHEYAHFRDRYFEAGGFPWDAVPPRRYRLSGAGLRCAQTLDKSGLDRLAVDRFLIEVLTQTRAGGSERTLPRWLGEAIEAWRIDSQAMGRGVIGLSEIACRSRGHVNRVLRQATGRPSIEVLNRIRMDDAAAKLIHTDTPISVVAADVGILSLSHFYRLFKEQFGSPPAHYRRNSGEVRND